MSTGPTTTTRTGERSTTAGGAPIGTGDGTCLYDFNVQALDGTTVNLGKFRTNPVVLIVNTASDANATDKNYEELETLYKRYQSKGFIVLGFPCNQFLSGEPLSNAELPAHLASKGVTFPVFGKLDVNGSDAHPLFKWLKGEAPGTLVDAIKWNFTKFLVVNGQPIKRFGPTDSPMSFESEIVAQLDKVPPMSGDRARSPPRVPGMVGSAGTGAYDTKMQQQGIPPSQLHQQTMGTTAGPTTTHGIGSAQPTTGSSTYKQETHTTNTQKY